MYILLLKYFCESLYLIPKSNPTRNSKMDVITQLFNDALNSKLALLGSCFTASIRIRARQKL